MTGVFTFLTERLAIEGIYRAPTLEGMEATTRFLALPNLGLDTFREL